MNDITFRMKVHKLRKALNYFVTVVFKQLLCRCTIT